MGHGNRRFGPAPIGYRPSRWRTELRIEWPDNFCPWNYVPPDLDDRLRDVVDSAKDERPIQEFLQEHPGTLGFIAAGGYGRWVWSRPRFGAEFVPDFLVSMRCSDGYRWFLIELESPRASPTTKSGRQSAKLTQAKSQIADWRIWLRKNIGYVHRELGFTHLDAECQAVVIIGRRRERSETDRERYRALSEERLTIMSYDRLIDMVFTWELMAERLFEKL